MHFSNSSFVTVKNANNCIDQIKKNICILNNAKYTLNYLISYKAFFGGYKTKIFQ